MIFVVSEFYMIKFHASLQVICSQGPCGCLYFFLFFQKFKYPFRRRCCGLQKVCHLCGLLDRRCEISHVLDERLDISHLNGFLDSQISTQDHHAHIAQISYKLHDRHHHSGQELGLPGRAI